MTDEMPKAKVVVVILSLVVLILACVLTAVTWRLYATTDSSSAPECKSNGLPIDTSTPDVIPPFYDLTEEEISNVRRFLYEQPDLAIVPAANIFQHSFNSSFIQYVELHLPEKIPTLAFLDEGAKQPAREAIAAIIRGNLSKPIIEEYAVGPTSAPSYKRLLRKIPFNFRPFTAMDFLVRLPEVSRSLEESIGSILEESYGGRLINCTEHCLDLRAITAYSSRLSGDSNRRLAWITLVANIEYFTLHYMDMQFLLDLTSDTIKVDQVYYAGQDFDSIQEFVTAYEANTINKTKIPFPQVSKKLFSTMHRRGKLFPENPLPPPRSVSSQGQRYSIQGRRISYMGWQFHLRMSTVSGPQLFDIRYQNNRIVYELSLQEIAVFYSGQSPAQRVADFIDSMGLMGSMARGLVPGIDCPADSTFLNFRFSLEYTESSMDVKNAFCVFEHNTNMPLRRHLNYEFGGQHFFEGMMDTVLVVRTIITVVNYDYIFDFVFHQNGAIDVKASSTGFIIGSFFADRENPFGHHLKEHVLGNFHTHFFNFKVDMDIHGQENVFERLDLVPVETDHSQYSTRPGATYSQVKVVRNTIMDEQSAANMSDQPCYYTFSNKKNKSKYGVPMAYRLHSKGDVKQLLPKGKGNEPTIAWARYPIAVTKYKENERRSSSYYASWDGEDPVVDFQSFIDDNDNLNSQDLVCWVTMGMHHIPHTEDLPVTPTTGQGLEFHLLPHNYFDEDPAMGSSDSVRIDHDSEKGVTVTEYGTRENDRCTLKDRYNYSDVKENPSILFYIF